MQTKADLVRQINTLKAQVIDAQCELRDLYLALHAITEADRG